jgi:hypothetical protein
MVAQGNNGAMPFATGIGISTTIADNLSFRSLGTTPAANVANAAHAYLEAAPAVGKTSFTWLERTSTSGTYTIFGTGAAAGLQPYMQTGMAGAVDG